MSAPETSSSPSEAWLRAAHEHVEATRAKLDETHAMVKPWPDARHKIQQQSAILTTWKNLLRRYTQQASTLEARRDQLALSTRKLRQRRHWRFKRIMDVRREVRQLRRGILRAWVVLVIFATYAIVRWIMYGVHQVVLAFVELVRWLVQAALDAAKRTYSMLVDLFSWAAANLVVVGVILLLAVVAGALVFLVWYLQPSF